MDCVSHSNSYVLPNGVNLSIIVLRRKYSILFYMKLPSLLLFLVLLHNVACTSFIDNYEGLCGNVPATCSTSVQKYGVCCSRNAGTKGTLYNNWCLACKSVTVLVCRAALVSRMPIATGYANDHPYGPLFTRTSVVVN